MDDLTRRTTLKLIAGAGAAVATPACLERSTRKDEPHVMTTREHSFDDIVIETAPLGFMWPTSDPFLFCVHHDDRYPAGNDRFGPAASLAGRNIGSDFAGQDGWNMYHGDVVPGFPQHPHRGFETVTIVRRGLLDHADSLGAAARYGGGDVQWLTTGRGILHAEMFPLLDRSGPNPVELFQIWLNLPRTNKMVAPYFAMLWNEEIPRRVHRDAQGRTSELAIIAGRYADAQAPAPPPDSWASQADADVAIWTIKLDPGAAVTLPPAHVSSNRALYFFRGSTLTLAGRELAGKQQVRVKSEAALELVNGPDESELLLLQGRPIAEPVVQHGPFVMNTADEIRQAFADYQRTRFGGWPWPRPDPVHDRDGRFARHADGRIERPT